MVELEIGKIGAEFDSCLDQFKVILQNNQKELSGIEKNLTMNLEEYKNKGLLTAAFIGEYSAGKSTIISALTNRRDIKISADIATDKTTAYEWEGIHLIDTPGLFTERKAHDAITHDAIIKADLLVYCLTYSLFDAITAEDFKNLAFEQNFRQKMMLVVNKMSDEAGEPEKRIQAYKDSMALALKPFGIEEFPLSFIDAVDYIDSLDEGNEELKKLSRFDTFIWSLNKFVRDNENLARLDTPVRILIGHLNDASGKLCRNDAEENVYIELLNKLSKAIESERTQLRNMVKGISMGLSSKIVNIGMDLAQNIGKKDVDFDNQSKLSESCIRELSEEAAKEMENAINSAIEAVRERVSDILNSPLALSFMAHVENADALKAKNVISVDSVKRLKENMETFRSITETVGLTIVEGAVRDKAKIAGQSGGGFMRTTQVAGSNLHKGVYEVGKLIGFKFKPWQAVRLAKDIANVAKVVGPILAGISIAMDIMEAKQEAENEQKMSDARREINSEFVSIAGNFEHQFQKKLQTVEKEIFNEVDKNIHEARDNELSAISEANQNIRKIQEISSKSYKLLETIKDMVGYQEAAQQPA